MNGNAMIEGSSRSQVLSGLASSQMKNGSMRAPMLEDTGSRRYMKCPQNVLPIGR